MITGTISWKAHARSRRAGTVWALAAAGGLATIYVLVLGFANSFPHALHEFTRLWPWMTALLAGFAIQAGLYGYARTAAESGRSGGAGVAASGGTGALSMIACCAHHLTDVLPLLGLAGAAFILAAYQELFLLLGVLSSMVGLVFMLGVLRRHGLYPDQPSVLSRAVSWPADRAWPYVLAGAVVVFGVATVVFVIS